MSTHACPFTQPHRPLTMFTHTHTLAVTPMTLVCSRIHLQTHTVMYVHSNIPTYSPIHINTLECIIIICTYMYVYTITHTLALHYIICMYAHTYTYLFPHSHTYVHTHTHTHTHTHMHAHTHVHTPYTHHTHTHVRAHTHTHTHTQTDESYTEGERQAAKNIIVDKSAATAYAYANSANQFLLRVARRAIVNYRMYETTLPTVSQRLRC